MRRIIRFVISDADGTLVRGEKLIDPCAFSRMMQTLAKAQIPIAIASGRCYSTLKPLFGTYADRILFFPLDGTLAIAADTLLCSFPLDGDAIEDGLSLLSHVHVRGVELCAQNTSYLYANDPNIVLSEKKRLGDSLTVCYSRDVIPFSPEAQTEEPIYKIIVFFAPLGCTQRLDNTVIRGVRTVYKSDTVWEVIRKDISKRTAAETVCRALQISPEEVLAFGDNENDRELLMFAGTAVTMYGAKHDLFSITPYHTSNVAETVMYHIKKDNISRSSAARNR